jgi:CheY-like chemotaxis protein
MLLDSFPTGWDSEPIAEPEGAVDRPTILLVEDNEDNALICTTWLEHFGMRVVRAPDGREGLRLARTIAPDLILLDLSLPQLSGWEVAEALHGDGGTGAPIVVWSANDDLEDRDRAVRLGCAGYLVKPCELAMVQAEVERVLATRALVRVPARLGRWAGGAVLSALAMGAAFLARRLRGRPVGWPALTRPLLNAEGAPA